MIILASGSPRRKELLGLITEDFCVRVSDADETLPKGIEPHDAVLQLSRIKAEAVNDGCHTVIGADTVVALDGLILGKPTDEEHAYEMLCTLSGRTHSVFTGVTIRSGTQCVSFYEETAVTFYELSPEEIRSYIATGEPMDKAGSYGIQGKGSLFVKGIQGDYFNVVGLPISRLYRELKKAALAF